MEELGVIRPGRMDPKGGGHKGKGHHKRKEPHDGALPGYAWGLLMHIAQDIVLDPMEAQQYAIPFHPTHKEGGGHYRFTTHDLGEKLKQAVKIVSNGTNKLEDKYGKEYGKGWHDMSLHGGRKEPFHITVKVQSGFKFQGKDGDLLRVKVRES